MFCGNQVPTKVMIKRDWKPVHLKVHACQIEYKPMHVTLLFSCILHLITCILSLDSPRNETINLYLKQPENIHSKGATSCYKTRNLDGPLSHNIFYHSKTEFGFRMNPNFVCLVFGWLLFLIKDFLHLWKSIYFYCHSHNRAAEVMLF